MIQLLGLLKNPFVKIIADKTIGAITHKLEKDKIIKAKEIEAATKLDVAKVGVQLEQVKQQEHSWKDEWLVVFFYNFDGITFLATSSGCDGKRLGYTSKSRSYVLVHNSYNCWCVFWCNYNEKIKEKVNG